MNGNYKKKIVKKWESTQRTRGVREEGQTEAEAKISLLLKYKTNLCNKLVRSFSVPFPTHPHMISSSAMAMAKLTLFGLILLALIFTPSIKADGAATVDGLDAAAGGGSDLSDSSALKIEVDHLKSKITSLG